MGRGRVIGRGSAESKLRGRGHVGAKLRGMCRGSAGKKFRSISRGIGKGSSNIGSKLRGMCNIGAGSSSQLTTHSSQLTAIFHFQIFSQDQIQAKRTAIKSEDDRLELENQLFQQFLKQNHEDENGAKKMLAAAHFEVRAKIRASFPESPEAQINFDDHIEVRWDINAIFSMYCLIWLKQ